MFNSPYPLTYHNYNLTQLITVLCIYTTAETHRNDIATRSTDTYHAKPSQHQQPDTLHTPQYSYLTKQLHKREGKTIILGQPTVKSEVRTTVVPTLIPYSPRYLGLSWGVSWTHPCMIKLQALTIEHLETGEEHGVNTEPYITGLNTPVNF